MIERVRRQGHWKFTKESVFIQTGVLLVGMLLLVMGLFLAIMNRELVHNHQQRVREINLQLVEQTSHMTEEAVQILKEDMNRLLWSSSMVNYVIHPGTENHMLEIEIQQMLEDMAENSELIRQIWIYSAPRDKVIGSDGAYGEREDFADKEIMELHFHGSQASLPEQEGQTDTIARDGRICLVQDMILAEYAGSVYLELDSDALWSLLGMKDTSEAMAIADITGEMISCNRDINPWVLSSIKDAVIERKLVVDSRNAPDGESQWYGIANPSLSWYFLRQMDVKSLQLHWMDSLPAFLPEILLLILLGILGCFLLTRKIYEPINRLVYLVLNRNESEALQPDVGNEMDYLQLSFFRTLDEKTMLENSMAHFSKDIQEQVFKRLLQGSSLEEAGYNHMESAWRSRWEGSGCWKIFLCQRENEIESISQVAETELFYRSVCQIIGQANVPEPCIVIRMTTDSVAVLLTESEDKNLESRILSAMEEAFASGAYRVSIQVSEDITELSDLHEAWEETRQRLHYKRYIEESFHGVADRQAEMITEESVSEKKSYYQEHAKNILEITIQGQYPKARNILGSVVNELIHEGLECEDTIRLYEEILILFLEKYRMIAGRGEDHELRNNTSQIPVSRAAEMSTADLRQVMTQQLEELLEAIWTGSRKSTYQYVVMAKQYMQEHFNDNALGVSEVAEYVHIHSTYLSKIFNEMEGESFSNWLNQVRVKHARELLRNTELPIGTIGFQCGFTTVQSFNRAFKKITGVTPSVFRKNDRDEG